MSSAVNNGWVCQCRRCHGVRRTADAVWYAYECFMGDSQREMVVAFATLDSDGRGSHTVPFLEGEPDVLDLVGRRLWVYSWRPGRSALPTEGDIARWERWRTTETNLVDWVLIDGTSWTSVLSVAAALRERRPIPPPETFTNFWWEEPTG